KVLDRWGSTGVQEVINKAVFDAGHFIAVFPVENEAKLTDHEGRVLPDVFLLPEGSTAKDLAYAIHTELGEKFIAAIDARTKRKLPGDYTLKHRDVIKIVTSR
ncbi:MAG: redox-regulated ATPase YchF, partial [Thermoprotei archaeon]